MLGNGKYVDFGLSECGQQNDDSVVDEPRDKISIPLRVDGPYVFLGHSQDLCLFLCRVPPSHSQ